MLGVLLVVLVGIVRKIPGSSTSSSCWKSESRTVVIGLKGVFRQLDVVIVQALHRVPSYILELREDQEGNLNGDTSSSSLALSTEQIQPSPV